MRPLALSLVALSLVAGGAVADRLAFDEYHDYEAMVAFLEWIAAEHPGLVTVESIGKSVAGRDLWLATVTDRSTGEPSEKPAVYVDGAHHGNEVASAEVPLYLIQFLVEGAAEFEVIADLLATRTFYVMPRVNPDGAEWYYRGVTVRGNLRPRDDDGDGAVDEDGPDDVDGDGLVLEMAVPAVDGDMAFGADGRPRRARRGDERRYRIQREGSDDDGDGRIDEDGPNEGADLNRNYPDPKDLYPGRAERRLTEPESRAVDAFLRSHPNISNVQSFHTFGGILFRPMGALPDTYIPDEDLALYDRMGKNFTRYTGNKPYGRPYGAMGNIKGALLDYAYGELDAYAVTAELWRVPGEDRRETRSWSGGLEGIFGPAAEREWARFNDEVLGGSAHVDWTEFEHPTLGRVRIGGWSPYFKRNPPVAYLEDVCHKATIFSLYQALMTPRLVATDLAVDGRRVRATLTNEGVLPTLTHFARQLGRSDPIVATLEAGDRILARQEIPVLDGEATAALDLSSERRLPSGTRLVVRSRKGGVVRLALPAAAGD